MPLTLLSLLVIDTLSGEDSLLGSPFSGPVPCIDEFAPVSGGTAHSTTGVIAQYSVIKELLDYT